jgi:hypothetical protein
VPPVHDEGVYNRPCCALNDAVDYRAPQVVIIRGRRPGPLAVTCHRLVLSVVGSRPLHVSMCPRQIPSIAGGVSKEITHVLQLAHASAGKLAASCGPRSEIPT